MEAYLYGIITFADPAVEAICLANFDTNGSGYISKEEAKAVKGIGTIFQGNTDIVSFDEFNEFLGITSIVFAAFQNCTSLRRINIPQNVTRLENYVFNGCENLESISLPNSLTTIDDGVFTNCKMLENIDIPYSCVNWNGGAQFRFCEKLKSITFPTGVTRIPGYCLDSCKSLESVQIPETVTTIVDNAFSNTAIEKIDLGANITEIGNYICFACRKLKVAIVRATTPPKSGANIFYLADCQIYVPDQSVTAYREASGWSAYADRIKPLSQYVEPTNE
jgi:hypothetical protein